MKALTLRWFILTTLVTGGVVYAAPSWAVGEAVVAGRVTSHGVGVPGAHVEFFRDCGAFGFCEDGGSGRTDGNGNYRLELSGGGSYTANVMVGTCWAPLRFDSAYGIVEGKSHTINFGVERNYSVFATDNYACRSAPLNWISGVQPFEIYGEEPFWLDLPFPITYYGASHKRIRVGAGWVSFLDDGGSVGCPDIDCPNENLPDPAAPNGLILPWWPMKWPAGTSLTPTDKVYTRALGNSPNRTFVVEWRNFDGLNFEVVFYESGLIAYQYRTVDGVEGFRYGETVGLEDQAATKSFEYSICSTLGCGRPVIVPGTRLEFRYTDADGPQLVSQSPAPGSVTRSSSVVAKFDEWVRLSSSISVTDSLGQSVGGNTVLGSDLSTLAFTPGVPFASGIYNASVTADSEGGARTTYDWSFEIDRTPPSVSVIAPAAGAVQGFVPLEASATDNHGVSTVTWKLNVTPAAALSYDPSTGSYKSLFNSGGIDNGNYTLTYQASDVFGNTAAVSVPISITNNRTPAQNSVFSTKQGVASRQNVNSLETRDGDHIVLIASPTSPTTFGITWELTAARSATSTNVLATVVTLGRTYRYTSGSVIEKVYVYDHVLERFILLTNILRSSTAFIESQSKMIGANPQNFVGADGIVIVRMEATSALPFTQELDLARVEVVY